MAINQEQFKTISRTTRYSICVTLNLSANILGPKWLDDMTHVAAATVYRADAIISWNFKHIVRFDKMKAYNQVNLFNGYGILAIISPMEVLTGDDD